MGDFNTVILYLVISNIVLWIIVLCLAGIKVKELIHNRTQIKARIMDDNGCVKAEYTLGRQTELLIGKSTPANMVHIDFSDSAYSGSIEEDHASFKRYGADWYICSKAGNGMVGLKQKGDDTVYKLRKDIPYRVQCGDVIYISYEKIMLQHESKSEG